MGANGTYEIRTAAAPDLAAIEYLMSQLNALHAEGEPSVTRKAPPDTNYLTSVLQHPEQAILLALANGDPAGLVQIEIKQSPDFASSIPRTYAYMAALVVDEAHRGKGVGASLTARAEQWATGFGATKIQLGVWEWNTDAIKFYEHEGYTTFNRRMWKDI